MSTTATPDHGRGDAVSDAELGGDILFGLIVGTPLTYVVVLVVCLVAGIGLGNSLAVSIVPCVLSGVFFGGVFPLSRQMARHEAAEREARAAVAPVTTLVDVVDVVPAA
jgi:Na+/citrate or Na+/malate symporter